MSAAYASVVTGDGPNSAQAAAWQAARAATSAGSAPAMLRRR